MESETALQGEAYVGLLDNFASEIGSTLEDLVSEWNEPDFLVDDVIDGSRTSSFKSQISMNSWDGMTDLSLKKARPLSFANPVYDLINSDGSPSQSRQLTLIPLSQFDINKPRDDSPTKNRKSKKRGSHGLINKLSSFTMRKHSLKKRESEMNVTAPLWTDAPSVTYSYEGPRRSASLNKGNPSGEQTGEGEGSKRKKSENQGRPASLDIAENREEDLKIIGKQPPPKLPRTSRGSYSPLNPQAGQSLSPKSPDGVFVQEDPHPSSLELPENKRLISVRSASSCGSLSSDLSDDTNLEDGRTTKTMMEVMSEIGDDPTPGESIPEPKPVDDKDENKDDQRLKRNKTLKWSGSRAAPALIREFTKKSKRADASSVESPAISGSSSPATSPRSGDGSQPVAAGNGENAKSPTDKLVVEEIKTSRSAPTTPSRKDASAFTVLSSLLPPAPKLRRTESSKIRTYINRMGTNVHNALGYAATQFVKQTLQSSEHRPVVLLHSVRSFLTDIKRYLMSNPQVGFMSKIKKILKNGSIRDVEGAIDDALERLVLYPLRDHIYKRLVLEYAKSGKIKMLEDAIQVAKTKSPIELGIRSTLVPPNEEAMEEINSHFVELQVTYSPYYKLKHLLSAVTTIYRNTTDLTCEDRSARKIGADDFLPLLVFAIVKCNFTAADIESQYIDGLLDPTLLLGEGGYYLTTMISAVQVLSSMKRRDTVLPNISDLQGFLKVGISSKTEKSEGSTESENADNEQSLLLHKTLHVPPSMTAHNLGMMIAKKYGMKSAKNFCLHVVVNGIAYPLKPQEFPQLVKMDLLTQFSPSSFYFIYRQIQESPEKLKSPKRPVTMDTEHLKINTEDGNAVMETAAAEESKEENVIAEDAPPSQEDVRMDVDELPSQDSIHLPPDMVDDSYTGIEDPLPEPEDLPTTEQNPTAEDLTSDVGNLPPPGLDDEKEFKNKNLDVHSNPACDSEDEIPPYLETYEAGECVDADVSSTAHPGGLVEDSPPISNTTKNNNIVAGACTGGETLLTSFPLPPPEDTGSGYDSDYDNLRDSPDVSLEISELNLEDAINPDESATLFVKEEDIPIQESHIDKDSPIKYTTELAELESEDTEQETETNEGQEMTQNLGQDTAFRQEKATPHVTVTDLSMSDDPSDSTTKPAESDTNYSDSTEFSEGRRSVGCHSEGYSRMGDDTTGGRVSRGYHSEGHETDDIFHEKMTGLGSNASVSALKDFFEERIIEVAQKAMKDLTHN